jgi:phosphohistidine phosphatase
VEIYGIRHGIAVDSAPSDAERWLTPKGIEKTKNLAQQLKETVGKLDLILSSPLVRAQQTAQVLLAAGCSEHLEIFDFLGPDGQIEPWLAWLKNYRSTQPTARRIALIGHAPNLGRWAELLVFGKVFDRIQLKKSGVVALRAPDDDSPLLGNCELLGLMPPKYWL